MRTRGTTNHPGLRPALMLALALIATAGIAGEATVGNMAPDFELAASDGQTHRLADWRGRTVVLAWFPKAFTEGCTIECKVLAESGAALAAYDVVYAAISVDDVETNTRFAESLGARYPILADPSKETATAYGVLSERGYANRWTFYIGPDGVIQHVATEVDPANTVTDIVARLDELGVARRDAAAPADS